MSKGESTIKTYVRIRPPATNCVYGEGGTLNCCDRIHHFDHVFSAQASDEQIFERVGSQLVENTLRGLNSTLFAYGQTGTGKTYTMTGNSMREGLVQRTVALLLRRLVSAPRVQAHSLRLNYIEIYNQSVRDLLAEKEGRVTVREAAKNGFYVEGVQAVEVRDAHEFNNQLQRGLLKRSVKSTKMNEVSSRSHTILSVLLEAKVGVEEGCGWVLRQSKLNFVDLAGSQKQKQTDVGGSKLKEASSINKSLTTLSLVISKLADKTAKAAHVPYRESVLTKLLKDSIGGNSVTAFIGTISGQKAWIAQTLSTLLFLERLKSVKNVVEVNEKVQGKEQELQRVISVQQQRINELQNRLAQSQQQRQEVNAHMLHLQTQLEQAQLQVRELEERLEQDSLPSFFTHFHQEAQMSSFFDPCPQQDQDQEEEDSEDEEVRQLSIIPQAIVESEDPKEKHQQSVQEQVAFQTEVKSKRQAASSQRMSTASAKARGGGKSLWQMESEFLREEVKRYSQDERVYGDFVQLISQHMGNFQFAAAQILILRAQAERLTRTEAHLQAYRAKLAQLTALTDARSTKSVLLETPSNFGTVSSCSQSGLDEGQVLAEVERSRREVEEGVRVRGEMEERHRVQLFRVQEQLLAEQEEHHKTSDQLQFLKDENSRLTHINQLYQHELSAPSTSDYSSLEEKEIQSLRQKVADLQEIIENDFITAIEELQLDNQTKTQKITAITEENQALRENICGLQTSIDELRLKCSQLQAEEGLSHIPEAHTLLAAQYDALCIESQLDKSHLRQLQVDVEQAREEAKALHQRLRSQEESHRQAQTYFRYELKVRKGEISKMKEEWMRASADRDISIKQQQNASQALTALQQEITQLTTRIHEMSVQLEEAQALKTKAESMAAAEGARVHECVCSILRAEQHYRSEERRFSRFKEKCQRELDVLREQNRQLQQNGHK